MTYRADGNRTPPTAFTTGIPQTITDTWADLGTEVNIDRMEAAALLLELDVGSSVDIRVRLLIKTAYAGALEYPLQIKTISSTAANLNPEYMEYDPAGDANVPYEFTLRGLYQVGQFQIMAGTVGGTAGIVTTALWSAST